MAQRIDALPRPVSRVQLVRDGLAKPCTKCNEVKPLTDYYASHPGAGGVSSECKVCWGRRCREYVNRDREYWLSQMRGNTIRVNENLREAVFEHYGRECACCGSTRGLGVIHLDPAQRQGDNSYTRYRGIIEADFPEGYGTLCKGCSSSMARDAGGKCMHVRQREEAERGQVRAAALARARGMGLSRSTPFAERPAYIREFRAAGLTLQEIADVFGVSRERIRQQIREMKQPQ